MTYNNFLSIPWKLFFLAEIPICLITCLYWILFPSDYIQNFNNSNSSYMEASLLQQCAIVVFCCYVYFYYKLLMMEYVTYHTYGQIFIWFQEAMLLGDILVILQSLYVCLFLNYKISILIAQIGMASFFGIARIIFMMNCNMLIK